MKGFNFYQDRGLEWRWRLKDGNGAIVADSGESYKDRKDCEKGAALFTTLGPNAPERKVTKIEESGHGPEWEYFEDRAGEWRWHFQAKNNKTLADSAEGYASEQNVKRAFQNVKALLSEIGKQNGNNGNQGGGYVPPASGGATGGGRFA
ncbi:uncharacterized protein YegP (UPF0339 family) [Pontibacter ummariensis]|uniref:Uncharacterized conserved protein YegP, UPF0339 family n=1 Tax=Pontibacter ummariensis TaxID=1610492 RepID=A0A239DV63_9BACT|nr:DUF1508 domain-containing protein [Pontibacter ummariensis]PRY13772.1 uncharacterized protein YegP (UPF0339 family) [Pontibacter ummariensis]SNS35494.1 Uncharacterized conserved protein YegP, UPF0339 family [Pontibacter ummariensis]